MENIFLVLCGLVVIVMLGLGVGLFKMASELTRSEEDGSLYLDSTALRDRAGDDSDGAGVRAGKDFNLGVRPGAKAGIGRKARG